MVGMAVIHVDEFLRSRDVASKTKEHYFYKLGLLAQYVGKRRLSLRLLAEYPGWLRARGYADASIQSTVAAARAYVRWAVERGYADDECLRWRPRLRLCESAPKAINDQDAERMIESTQHVRDRALLLMLRDTGARIGTILGLDVGDIDLSGGRAIARQKGGRLLILYLSERLRVALREYIGARQDGPLFLGRDGRMGMGGVRYILRQAARRAGVNGRYNAHAWRHAFARRCVRAGLDLSRTARLMGHASFELTAKYYAVWDGKELAEAYARVCGM